MDFEIKLAAAGEVLEKLAAERGLNVADFTEQEVGDLLLTIMGEEKQAAEEPQVAHTPAQPVYKAASAQPQQPQLTYGQVMAEVVKVASANGYDISQASPAELDDAVVKMAELLSNPEFMQKQAALNEKVAEADAMGRIMAHAYVNELSKLAAAAEETQEKKAALRADLSKLAEVPEAFKKKDEKKCEKCEKDPCECDKSKEASDFAKAASARAAELLIENGINPETGAKFASQQEKLDAGAALILREKGYL